MALFSRLYHQYSGDQQAIVKVADRSIQLTKKFMTRSQIKREILSHLKSYTSEILYKKLDTYDYSRVIGPLFSALCNANEGVRWNAVYAFGYVVPKIADEDMETARIVMRRFLWSLNDESGGIGWGAPEAIAEILCHHDQLRKEYLHMLISYMREDGEEEFQDGNFLELPLLQRGLLWGVGRLCQEHPAVMVSEEVYHDLCRYLPSNDSYVAGLAMRALTFLPDIAPVAGVEKFLDSAEVISLYVNEEMIEVSLSALALELLKK